MRQVALALSPLGRGLVGRGTALVLLGCAVLAWPEPGLRALLVASALSLVLVSAFDIVHAVGWRRHVPQWWLFGMRGVAGLAVGAALLLVPIAPAIVVGIAIAGWLGFQGIAFLDAALLASSRHRLPLLLAGLLCFVPTMVALSWPMPTHTGALYVTAGYALVAGALDLGIGLWLVLLHRTPAERGTHARAA